ncbi:MAG: copper chaperone PCu(A)C [Sneathiellales bacterium]|nr:copper chaperone PCu(A)C [Sneathiellales bacterium]
MKNKTTLMAALVAGSLSVGALVTPALAHEHGKKIMVDDAWTRARTASAKVAGAFMTLKNMTKEDDRLVSASSPISSRTEIHTTKMDDGVMKMIRLNDGIEVKSGATVQLKPGSYHVMFMGLKEQLSEGKQFPVTLTFEKSGTVDVTVSVKKAGAKSMMDHGKMNHGNMKHDGMKKAN